MTESPHLPARTRRLFAHYEKPEGFAHQAPAFMIGRILEEGDSADLEWLFKQFSDYDLRSWLIQRGSRQLTRRSRLFWQMVFACAIPDPPPLSEQLWPL